MAFDAKMSFLEQIEKQCADKLTVTDMGTILSVIGEVMDGFEMRECRVWDEKDDMLDTFISAMRVQGRSEKTIERYRYIIGRFMKYVKVPTRRVNVYHVRNWLAAEKGRGVADSTLEGNRQVLSSFFGWLFRETLIEKNPLVNVGVIKVPKKIRKTYSDMDMARLNRGCHSIRDKAIINFLATTGCRVSEMTSLDRDALDLIHCECIIHGKGNKERIVFFDRATGMLLEDYLAQRKDDCPALFLSKQKKRLEPGGVRIMLKVLAKETGVEHVHPHKFRRTFATELARKMPIQEISKLLGHEKLETSMRYVNVNDDDIRHDYRKFA